MNRTSRNTHINEIRFTPCELLTTLKDIADHLNKHVTEIGERLASKIPKPPAGISFEGYLNQTNSIFRL